MFRYHKILNISNITDFNTLDYYFSKAKKEIYLVGGCVRDLLLGRTPKDYDLCTNATPEEVIRILSNVKVTWTEEEAISAYSMGIVLPDRRYSIIETGIKHGTVTIHDHKSNNFYEITTWRTDGKYSDGRHPDKVTFTPSLEEDMKRRDFTINSFAYDFIKGDVLMLDGAFLDDLTLGIIRTVGNPYHRFEEDALRMLRAIRFAAQLNFHIYRETYVAIEVLRAGLCQVSRERIRDEVTKILLSDNPHFLEYIVLTGMEPFIFGPRDCFEGPTPLTDMHRCPHDNPHHYTDVFHHTMDVVKQLPPVFELRWAALLHDIGKPVVKTPKLGHPGEYSYIGHEKKSVELACVVMGFLKFSTDQMGKIYDYVLYHDYPIMECSMKKFKQLLVKIGVNNFLEYLQLRKADAFAHKLTENKEDNKFVVDQMSIAYDRFNLIMKEKHPLTIADLAIDGNDLLKAGYQGKQIGECLEWALDKVLVNPKANTKQGLLDSLKHHKPVDKE